MSAPLLTEAQLGPAPSNDNYNLIINCNSWWSSSVSSDMVLLPSTSTGAKWVPICTFSTRFSRTGDGHSSFGFWKIISNKYNLPELLECPCSGQEAE